MDIESLSNKSTTQKLGAKNQFRVLIIDDLLATGGTVKASIELVKKLRGELISCAFLIELLALKGAKLFHPIEHFSIIKI
mgnify:CR=1 FL=1